METQCVLRTPFPLRPSRIVVYDPHIDNKDRGMDSKEIIRRLEADGWHLVRVNGSHHHYRHPTKPGTVTVPHPKKDLKVGTVKSIEKQAGAKLR